MSTYVSNRDGGKTNEEGHYRFQVNAYSGNVLTGMTVSANSPLGMSVLVGTGELRIPYTSYAYTGWNDASSAVTIATANSSNPRIDRIVAYIDRGMTPQTTNPNNPGMLKFLAVAGTPAASPTKINDAGVTSAVQTAAGGTASPWCELATVLVGTSVTQITTPNITDTRVYTLPTMQDYAVLKQKLERPHYATLYFSDGTLGQVFGALQTRMVFTAADSNSYGLVTTTGADARIKTTRAGLYRIDFQAVCTDVTATGFILWFCVSTDGTNYTKSRNVDRQVTDDQTQLYSKTCWLPADAYVMVEVYNGGGNTRFAANVNTNELTRIWTGTHLSVTEIR